MAGPSSARTLVRGFVIFCLRSSSPVRNEGLAPLRVRRLVVPHFNSSSHILVGPQQVKGAMLEDSFAFVPDSPFLTVRSNACFRRLSTGQEPNNFMASARKHSRVRVHHAHATLPQQRPFAMPHRLISGARRKILSSQSHAAFTSLRPGDSGPHREVQGCQAHHAAGGRTRGGFAHWGFWGANFGARGGGGAMMPGDGAMGGVADVRAPRGGSVATRDVGETGCASRGVRPREGGERGLPTGHQHQEEARPGRRGLRPPDLPRPPRRVSFLPRSGLRVRLYQRQCRCRPGQAHPADREHGSWTSARIFRVDQCWRRRPLKTAASSACGVGPCS